MTNVSYPVAEFDWTIVSNVPVGPNGNNAQYSFLWTLKEILIGHTGTGYPTAIPNPWTVVASSDSVNADIGIDHWITPANLIMGYAPTPHSWIVLKQAVTGLQLMFACEGEYYTGYGSVVISCKTGFTGGTINNRPTAGDEVDIVNGQYLAPFGTVDTTGFLHVWHSTTDGSHTKFAACVGGFTSVFASFDLATAQTGTTWDAPCTGMYLNGTAGSTICTFDTLKNNANVHFSNNGVAGSLYCACESWSNTVYPVNFTTAMSTTGTWCAAPITGLWITGGKMVMPSSAGTSAIPDILWGCSSIGNGAGYLNPVGGTRDWVQLGNLIVPWDNTIIEIS